MRFIAKLLLLCVGLFSILPQEIKGMKRQHEDEITLAEPEEGPEEKKPKSANNTQALCLAIQRNDFREVTRLLDNGEDVNVHDVKGVSPLGYALEKGSMQIVEKIWGLIDLEASKQAAFIYACAIGREDVVRFISSIHPSFINTRTKAPFLKALGHHDASAAASFNNALLTPLIAATYFGRTNVVEILLKFKPDLHIESSGKTALWHAIEKEHGKIIELLLEAGAFDKNTLTIAHPLRLAATKGNVAVVKALLKAKPLAMTADANNDLIILALEFGHQELVDFLIDRELNSITIERCDRILEWLIRHNDVALHPKIKDLYKDKKHLEDVLFKAALQAKNYALLAEILAHSPARINQPIDASKETPLGYACVAGNLELVTFLCGQGADVRVLSADPLLENRLATPLLAACLRNLFPIAELLIKNGVDLNHRMPDGNRAIDVCGMRGLAQACTFLITKGADVRGMPECNAAIQDLCNNARVSLIRELLNAGGANDRTSIETLAKYFDPEQLDVILFIGALQTAQFPLLQEIMARGRIDLNEPFIADGPLTRTPLGFACARGNQMLAGFLLDHGASLNTESPDELGAMPVVPLVVALLHGQFVLAEYLLERGASLNNVDSHGCPPLRHAIRVQHNAAIEFLVSHGAHFHSMLYCIRYLPVVKKVHDECVKSFVDACNRGDSTRILSFLERGMNVRMVVGQEKSPLVCALASGSVDSVRLLMEKGGGFLALTEEKNPAGLLLSLSDPLFEIFMTCHSLKNFLPYLLLKASLTGNQEKIERLLKAGMNVNTKENNTGFTPLILAARSGHRACVELLIKHNADVLCKDQEGKNAMAHAANDEIARLIENSEAFKEHLMDRFLIECVKEETFIPPFDNIHIQDGKGKSLLRHAVEREKMKALQYLLKNKIKVNLADYEGVTPLMCAASLGDLDSVNLLCAANAAIPLQDKNKRSAVGYASRNGHCLVAERLLNLCHPDSFEALINEAVTQAIAYDQQEMIKRLLVLNGDTQAMAPIILRAICEAANKRILDTVLTVPIHDHILLKQLDLLLTKGEFALAASIIKKLRGVVPPNVMLKQHSELKQKLGACFVRQLSQGINGTPGNVLLAFKRFSETVHLLNFCKINALAAYSCRPDKIRGGLCCTVCSF